MKHKDYKEMIQFYLYDELESEEKLLFEKHIATCGDCASELESYKIFFAKILNGSQSTLDDKILTEARQGLRGVLRMQRNQISITNKIKNFLSSIILKPTGLALSGLSVLFVCIFIGYLFKSPVKKDTKTEVVQPDHIKIQNINFIDSDPSDGEVEFTFDAVKPGRIKGNVNDSELQKILTDAILNERNPGTRLNSINVINATQSNGLDDEIKKSFIAVAKYDDNPGVRMEALKALKEVAIDNEIKSAMIYILLNDTSSGIRIQAINALVDAAKNGFGFTKDDVSLFRNTGQVDKNNYIRFQANYITKEY